MFCKKINLLIISALLAGCTVNYDYPEIKQTTVQEHYGIWDLKQCQLSAQRADIKVILTDIYKEDKARVVVISSVDLENTPKINIYGLEGYDFDLIGANKSYVIEIPTGLLEQARMHLNQTFLQVQYQVKGSDYYRKAIFSLQEFPQAMLDIKKTCI